MNKFEFIGLKEYPEGQYPTAIATVRINLKDEKGYPVREVVRFARKMTKEGGTFWAMASHNVVVNGEKKYLPGFKLDSDIDEEMLLDFIKENVKKDGRGVLMEAQVHYPHGLVQPHVPTSMKEVANEQPLPF